MLWNNSIVDGLVLFFNFRLISGKIYVNFCKTTAILDSDSVILKCMNVSKHNLRR